MFGVWGLLVIVVIELFVVGGLASGCGCGFSCVIGLACAFIVCGLGCLVNCTVDGYCVLILIVLLWIVLLVVFIVACLVVWVIVWSQLVCLGFVLFCFGLLFLGCIVLFGFVGLLVWCFDST